MTALAADDRLAVTTRICDRISNGERIHAACAAEHISWRDLWYWKAQNPALAALYAHAREASAESWEDKGTQVVESAEVSEDVAVARLREDHYRWRARMANPKGFSDRAQLDVKHGLDESLSGLIAAAFTGATIEGAARVVELPAVSVEYTIEVNEAESLEVVSPETRAETNGKDG